MSKYKVLIEDCERDIRGGQANRVAKRLSAVNTARVPRAFRLPLANLCRRSGFLAMGTTLLARLVHPAKGDQQSPATAAERGEYAALLLRMGALNEALQILGSIDRTEAPETALYQAFCHFVDWNHAAAIPLLEYYFLHAPNSYQKLVAQVNLAYALLETGQLDRALTILEDGIEKARRDRHARLESNTLALQGQLFVYREEFEEARKRLDAAQNLIGPLQVDNFIIKWRLIGEALQGHTTEPLDQLQAHLQTVQDWEGVRESDLFRIRIDFQKGRFLHLIFGTPFAHYRERVLKLTGEKCDRQVYVYGMKAAPRLDLTTGELDGAPLLDPGRQQHRIINAFLHDFYRPLRLAEIFSELFPGEHFDIFSSPDRVHQALRRARRWFSEKEIPLAIVENDGFYWMRMQGSFSFRVPLSHEPLDAISQHFRDLRTAFSPVREFTAREARERLMLSRRTIQRLVNWGIDTKKIERLGNNPLDIRYKFTG